MTTRKIYEVWNFGKTRMIPFEKSPIFLQSNWGFETADKKVVKVLKSIPYVSVKQLRTEKVVESPPNNKKEPQKITTDVPKSGASSATSQSKKKDEVIEKMKEVTSNG